MTLDEAKEQVIPIGMIVIALAIYAVAGALVAGAEGAGLVVMAMGIRAVILTILGLIACMLTAKVMGASFGYLGPAVLKLAALFTFPDAVSMIIGGGDGALSWLVAIVLYLSLLAWLFELDAMEVVVLIVVIWFVRLFTGFILALALSGM